MATVGVLTSPEALAAWFGRVPLVAATIRLTKECDAHCPYCYSSAARPLPDELRRAEVLGVVDQIAELGALRMFVSGGEPTLSPHLCDVVARAAGSGIRVAVSTHGGHLGPRLVDRLGEAGISQLQVSLDAPGPVHDEIRRIPGLYRKALEGVGTANRLLPPACDVIVATVVTRLNLPHVEAVFADAAEAGARSFVLVPLVVTGRASRQLAVPVAGLLDLARRLERPAPPVPALRVALLLPPALSGTADGAPVSGYVRPYPYEVAVDANGDVALADIELNPPKRLIGNVRNERLASMWRRAVGAVTGSLTTDQPQMQGVCALCRHWDVCGGGNRPLSRRQTGRVDASDPHCQEAYDDGAFPASALLAAASRPAPA